VQSDTYTPGQIYTVTLNSSYPSQMMLGFMLVAVPVNAEDETTQMGQFQHTNGQSMYADACPYVITQRHLQPTPGMDILWTAPPQGSGCVEFRATVMEYGNTWYKDDGSLTKVVCELTSHAESSGTDEMIPECCACGVGKYQMTFEGLWSRQSHPKGWPSNKRLLHWSNVVGASHSKDYKIWEYGNYASKGIKQVCEYGISNVLEDEMRKHSGDVRTVVKTPGIYWNDPDGLRQSRWARFSVDRNNHLLSMLTMMGPSPDWCVGVPALDLCLPNCTWAEDIVIDLYPFDAGTDDGQSYLAQNARSDPQQRIVGIKADSVPLSSPFHTSEALKPLAKLTLHRIHPKPGAAPDTCTGNETHTDDYEDDFGPTNEEDLSEMERKKLMMMKQAQMEGKCAFSWMDWSGCSVTCGSGERFRKRQMTHPMGDLDICGLSVMENEECVGKEGALCESIGDACAMTGWSDWSPCSVSCGKGIRQRRRYYLSPGDSHSETCTRDEDDSQMCIAEEMDCEKLAAMKNFTAICSLPMDVGPCRGFFMRWYYDVGMKKCARFPYGGCRGNNNRFRSLEECTTECFNHMHADDPAAMKKMMLTVGASTQSDGSTESSRELEKRQRKESRRARRKKQRAMERAAAKEAMLENGGQHNPVEIQGDVPGSKVDCMITEWSEWSECTATCGQAAKSRQRMVKAQPENGGKKCPTRLEKTKKCKVPKCATACILGPWSHWSACSATCGENSVQERMRQVISSARHGGSMCDPRLERRICRLPACAIQAQPRSNARPFYNF